MLPLLFARRRHVAPIDPGGGSPFYSLASFTPDLGGTPAAHNGGKNTTYLLWLPVRNSLVDNSSAVGTPPGAYLAGSPPNTRAAPGDAAPLLRGGADQVIWYGTSIQQGGVASRAGNLYDAILSRRLSREVLNFGFAGNGHEDIGVAKHIVTLPVRVPSRSTAPPWGSIRVRLALRTYAYAPWGVRVVPDRLTKSRKIPTRNVLPLFLVASRPR